MDEPQSDIDGMLKAIRARRQRVVRVEGVIAVLALLVVSVLYGFWHEGHEGPRHERYARWALAKAGVENAALERDWFIPCGRGSKGYRWRTASAEGRVCTYRDGAQGVRAS